jgi:hypothetical protein
MTRVGIIGIQMAILLVLTAAQATAKDLSVVKPVMACENLARAVIATPGEAPARIYSATLVTADTPSPYCQVKGYVSPQVKFELRLPTEAWTQRLLFTGCGSLCGNINISVRAAEGCQPTTKGEIALVSSDLGHDSGANSGDALWAADNPQG